MCVCTSRERDARHTYATKYNNSQYCAASSSYTFFTLDFAVYAKLEHFHTRKKFRAKSY